jgi:hypothetical protein
VLLLVPGSTARLRTSLDTVSRVSFTVIAVPNKPPAVLSVDSVGNLIAAGAQCSSLAPLIVNRVCALLCARPLHYTPDSSVASFGGCPRLRGHADALPPSPSLLTWWVSVAVMRTLQRLTATRSLSSMTRPTTSRSRSPCKCGPSHRSPSRPSSFCLSAPRHRSPCCCSTRSVDTSPRAATSGSTSQCQCSELPENSRGAHRTGFTEVELVSLPLPPRVSPSFLVCPLVPCPALSCLPLPSVALSCRVISCRVTHAQVFSGRLSIASSFRRLWVGVRALLAGARLLHSHRHPSTSSPTMRSS